MTDGTSPTTLVQTAKINMKRDFTSLSFSLGIELKMYARLFEKSSDGMRYGVMFLLAFLEKEK